MAGSALFEWSTDYELGSALLDGQHKQLFAHANRLHAALLEGRGQDQLERLYDDLQAYAESHWTDELEWMRSIGFPGVRGHEELHRALLRELRRLQDRLRQGPVLQSIETLIFLQDWLVKHVAIADVKAVEYQRTLPPDRSASSFRQVTRRI